MKRIGLIGLIVTIGLGLLVGFILIKRHEEAKRVFTHATGIAWSPTYTLVRFSINNPSILSSEGESTVMVRLPPERCMEILNSPPPVGEKWERGPVRGKIGFHCGLGYGQPPGVSGPATSNDENFDGNTNEEYFGENTKARALLSSTDIVYCAQDRGPASMPYHHGTLVIMQPETKMMCVSVWNY